MKRIFIFLMLILSINTAFSQKLQWAKDLPASIVDHIDKNRNVYIGSESGGSTDIDPGAGVLNMTAGFLVKYDSLFSLKWYKTSAAYDNSIINTNKDGDVYAVTKSGTNYYLAAYASDGAPLFSKKIFNTTSMIGSNLFLWDIITDTASNVWISGYVCGTISFGTSGPIDTVTDGMTFLAKYNKNGDSCKIIKKAQDFDFQLNFFRGNYKMDTAGTIHQVIYDNANAINYITTDTLGNVKTKKILTVDAGNPVVSNLLLADSGNFFLVGNFTDAVDFDISYKIKYLIPKGSGDIFIAKYNNSGQLIDAWQIGGIGKIFNIYECAMYRNNYLNAGIFCDDSAVVDFAIGTDTNIIHVKAGHIIQACYDMSVYIPNDTITEYNTANDDLVADIAQGTTGSHPMYLTGFNDTLYFVADDGETGYELWKSDGTNNGTVLVKDISPFEDSFSPLTGSMFPHNPLLPHKNLLYFIPDTLSNLLSLWQTNGTTLSTVRVSDSIFKYLFSFNGRLFFQKYGYGYKPEIFMVTDSADNGTTIDTFPDYNPNLNFNHISYEDSFFYAPANSPDTTEIWKFDGKNFTRAFTFHKAIHEFVKYNNRYYFYELNTSYSIVPKRLCSVKTDGSDYQVLHDFSTNPTRTDEAYFFIKELAGRIIFTGYDDINKVELWSSDGTPGNAKLIKELNPGGNLRINNLVASDHGILFFTADNGLGNELYQTDGTGEGTRQLRGLNPFGKVNYNSLAIVNDVLYFGAASNQYGSELWKYNFIREIDITGDSTSYAADSSEVTIRIKTKITPTNATDTELDYELTDTTKHKAIVKTNGEISILPVLKSSPLFDTVNIRVQSKDGSGVSTLYSLIVKNLVLKNPLVEKQITVYPNPFSDFIYIKSSENKPMHVEVTDMTGQVLINKTVTGDILNVQNISPGIYLLKVEGIVFKLIKQ